MSFSAGFRFESSLFNIVGGKNEQEHPSVLNNRVTVSFPELPLDIYGICFFPHYKCLCF